MMLDVFFWDVFVFMLPVHPPLPPKQENNTNEFRLKKK